MKISDEEIKAALEAYYGTPKLAHLEETMRAALMAALKIRKARKKARKRLESEHEGEKWGACV